IHPKIRRERDSLAGKARALSVYALPAGCNIDVGGLGKRHILGRTREVLVVTVRFPHVLDTSLGRRRLSSQEEPPNDQDTEQKREQPGTQGQELHSTNHAHSPSLKVDVAFTASGSTPGLTPFGPNKRPDSALIALESGLSGPLCGSRGARLAP